MKLNQNEVKDKIYACWIGKNIGGTLGGPFENRRELLSVMGFTTPKGKPLPNDDLDLQLVWLRAIEKNGKYRLNEHVLGAYWQEYISPYWNEYGICKANMERGLQPPLSGEYDNEWKHSNGAWIRTEIWACLTPCLVDEAARFAYMDACVDHGVGEGTYAAVFVAAMESAAFATSDARTLIAVGLSKIPEDCRVAAHINMVLTAFAAGKTWQEARELVTAASLQDKELGWFQAPANVAYAIIGLLWGKGDFKESLLITVNCGDDTDCSAATLGALLGLMHGRKIIPADWQEYIGDDIITISINRGACYDIPHTCTDLSERVLALLPEMLRGSAVTLTAGESELPADLLDACGDVFTPPAAYSVRTPAVLSEVTLTYDRAPEITAGGTLGVTVTVTNLMMAQKHFNISFYLPEGWRAVGERQGVLVKAQGSFASARFTLIAGENVTARNRGVVEVSCEGHADTAYLPLVILG